MKRYLMIQNKGVAPIEGFTTLGISTTRNDNTKGVIGQFGSKHAINLLLRNDIEPIIFCGLTKMSFYTKEYIINDGLVEQKVNKVFCRTSGKNSNTNKDLGFVLEYGVHDWNNINMALREFVANAIDRTIRENENGCFKSALNNNELSVDIIHENKMRARNKYTRIFIPLTQEVQQFYGELPKRFLHFSENPDIIKQKVLPKGINVNTLIYKNGVLVREVLDDRGNPELSLFDYNFDDELRLDESRNADDY
ncbi:hypothetical protein LCGC14_2517990, partial [marine sediment metagenome]